MKVACIILVICLFASTRADFGFAELGKAVQALQPVLQNFKTETTTKMGELQHTTGFNSLETRTDFTSGAVHSRQLTDIFNFWISRLTVDGKTKEHLTSVMREAEFQELSVPYSRYIQDFKFGDGKGGLYFLRVILQRENPTSEIIRWEKVMWSAKFEVAKPFMIVTHTKCGLFSCKNKDEVRYFEAVLTPEHVAALRTVSIPFMSVISPSGQPLIKKNI